MHIKIHATHNIFRALSTAIDKFPSFLEIVTSCHLKSFNLGFPCDISSASPDPKLTTTRILPFSKSTLQ